VLVSSLLFSIGCYSTVMMTKEELKAKVEQADITVWTRDSLKYEFSKGNYHIQGDTLTGSGVRVGVNKSTHKQYKQNSGVTSIALADITSIETSEFSSAKTVLLIIGLGGVLLVTLWAVHMSHI
jgi:hypothetical protein